MPPRRRGSTRRCSATSPARICCSSCSSACRRCGGSWPASLVRIPRSSLFGCGGPAIFPFVPTFNPPNFDKPALASAPDARFVPAPADGVLPEGFFSTTNLPTYVRIGGQWRLPKEPRMDSALVLDPAGELWVREGRRLKKGDKVAVGDAEDGSQGIFVHAGAFMEEVG